MLFPKQIINQITDSATQADNLTRSELASRLIAHENDYTSNFIGRLRTNINVMSIPGLNAHIVVLNQRDEQRLGSDAKIVLANSTHFKVCIFEAKWPRLNTPGYRWDGIQAGAISHFHDQLLRQSNWASTFAIWEMFYCEFNDTKQPHFMSDYGSSCVWHHHALNASNGRRSLHLPWKYDDLRSLLLTHCITIYKVLEEACRCQRGIPKAGNDYEPLLLEYSNTGNYLAIEYDGVGD